MRLHIITVGNKMPLWVNLAYQEYAKRFPRDFPVTLTEIPLKRTSVGTEDPHRLKKVEGQKILEVLANPKTTPLDITIALDERGSLWNTNELKDILRDHQSNTARFNFIIGGPNGLSDECLVKAKLRWSLSPLTLPHPLVRVILIEQLYRAVSLLKHHPYHRE